MTSISRFDELDARAWSTATWAVPFTIQLVLGVAVAVSWLTGRFVADAHGFTQFMSGTAAALLLSAAASLWLFKLGSPRAQGVAMSIIGSFIAVLIGGCVYGLWIVGW